MEITLFVGQKKTKREANNDLFWYDTKNKIMLHGKGGSIQFGYDPELKRSFPYTVPGTTSVYEKNDDAILSWVRHNTDKYGLSVVRHDPGYQVVINTAELHMAEIEVDLYRSGISYDFDIEVKSDKAKGRNSRPS